MRQKLGTIVDFWFLFSSKDGNPLSADDIKIRCGEYDLKLGEIDQYDYQDRNVDTFTIHPFFSGMETLRNDIALIHTKEAFKQARWFIKGYGILFDCVAHLNLKVMWKIFSFVPSKESVTETN